MYEKYLCRCNASVLVFAGELNIKSLRFWEKYKTAAAVLKEYELEMPGKACFTMKCFASAELKNSAYQWITVADLWQAYLARTPFPLGWHFLNFLQFLGKSSIILCWRPSYRETRIRPWISSSINSCISQEGYYPKLGIFQIHLYIFPKLLVFGLTLPGSNHIAHKIILYPFPSETCFKSLYLVTLTNKGTDI